MNSSDNRFKKIDTSFKWSDHLDRVKSELGKASSSYCLAKWAHSTIHFQLGSTHSCYNLPMHSIPQENLKKNPSSLHNTPIKIEQRQQMLNGQRPPECAYCWNVEDLDSGNYSDRIIQSSGDWAYPFANEILQSGLGENILPKYLEVSFTNSCNLKCSYCSPVHSSLWQDEINQHGHYPVQMIQKMPEKIFKENENPYLDAFNEWWPTLRSQLKVFRITGGEPLLSKQTWSILEDIEKNPLPELVLSINSNLSVSDILIDKLIQQFKKILANQSVKRITIFTSVEAVEKQAEYIRHGLNYEKLMSNIEKILKEIPEIRISIMATFCALSVFSYQNLLKKVLQIRKEQSDINQFQRLGISTNYLRFPDHLSVHVLNKKAEIFFENIYSFMELNKFNLKNCSYGFTLQEISMFKNVQQWFLNGVAPEKQNQIQQDFKNYFKEHDIRRGTNLEINFPNIHSYLEREDS